jgi:hypothetical protein
MARKNDRALMRKKEILKHFRQGLIDDGVEWASMSKITSSMIIHPSLPDTQEFNVCNYLALRNDRVIERLQSMYSFFREPLTNDFSFLHEIRNHIGGRF